MGCFIDWLKRASAVFQQLTFSKSSVEKFCIEKQNKPENTVLIQI